MTAPEGGGRAICGACGHASATGTRFCTRCGIALPAPGQAPQPAPAEPSPLDPAPAATPDAPSPSRWALDTPPANESWWRNPIVVVVAAVSILFGGGVASWRFFISSGADTVSVVRALPSAGDAQPRSQPAVTTQATADVAVPVQAIGRLLRASQSGRAAALNRHDYGAALRNRRRLLAELEQVSVPAQPRQLARADAMLRAALEASARADAGHLACRCDAELSADVAASQLKRRFAMLFDPYALQYLGGPIDPNQI